MFWVSLSEVTKTQTAGSSQRTAQATMSPVNTPRRERIRSVLGVAAQQPELEEGEDEDHREEDPRHRGGRAELEKILERRLVEMLDHRARGVARTALGEDEYLPEDLEGSDDVGDEDEEEHRAEQRQGDGPEAPPPARAIEGGGLVELARDVLEAREIDDEVVARHPPDGGQDDRPHGRGGIREPGADRNPERLQVVVERPDDGVEEPEPHEPDRDHGKRERKEECAPEKCPQRGAPVERDRKRQRDGQDGQRAGHRVERRVDEAHMEARVLEEPLVVGKPDEGVLRATEPGIAEGQPQAVEQRVDSKGREQRESRSQKEIRRQRAPPHRLLLRAIPAA